MSGGRSTPRWPPWSVETDGLSPKQVVDAIVKAVDEEVAP